MAVGSLLRRAWRRTRPEALAYVGGVLLLVGGGAGSAVFYVLLTAMAAELVPELGPAFRVLQLAFLLVAALGGASVLVGGYLAETRRPRLLCSTFIALGAGMGLAGLALQLVSLVRGQGDPAQFARGWLTVAGLGTVFALLAQVRLVQRG